MIPISTLLIGVVVGYQWKGNRIDTVETIVEVEKIVEIKVPVEQKPPPIYTVVTSQKSMSLSDEIKWIENHIKEISKPNHKGKSGIVILKSRLDYLHRGLNTDNVNDYEVWIRDNHRFNDYIKTYHSTKQ